MLKMKIATVLSVAGVLTAGTAAALVNTKVMDDTPTAADASNALLTPTETTPLSGRRSSTTQPPQPPTTLPPTSVTTAPSTTAVASTVAPATTAGSGLLTTYKVGDAGSVSVDVVDGSLVIVSMTPSDGWGVTTDPDSDPNSVSVTYTAPDTVVKFQATYADGTIVPTVTSQSTAANNGPASNSGGDATPANDQSTPNTTTTYTPTRDDADEHESDDGEHDGEHDDDEHDGEHESDNHEDRDD